MGRKGKGWLELNFVVLQLKSRDGKKTTFTSGGGRKELTSALFLLQKKKKKKIMLGKKREYEKGRGTPQ